ncbi:MAG: hypothetical protein AB4040_17630 [Synechococcus sp.]
MERARDIREMNNVEKAIELLLDAARPRDEHPPGELDRIRAQQVASWERLFAAGMPEEAKLQALIEGFDSGLDYQRDHPLNEIDEALDSAMALARTFDADDCWAVSGLVDASVRSRLSTYAVRCAARALAQKSVDLFEAGLLACLLTIDPDNDRIDPRDLMVLFAPLHVAAQGSDRCPDDLFEQYADLAPAHASKTLRDFGRRTDVTLGAFGWTLDRSQPIPWIVLAG